MVVGRSIWGPQLRSSDRITPTNLKALICSIGGAIKGQLQEDLFGSGISLCSLFLVRPFAHCQHFRDECELQHNILSMSPCLTDIHFIQTPPPFLLPRPFYLSISLNKWRPAIATLLFVYLVVKPSFKNKNQKYTHQVTFRKSFTARWRVVHQTCLLKIVSYQCWWRLGTGLQPLFLFLVSTLSLFPSSYLGSESSEGRPPATPH